MADLVFIVSRTEPKQYFYLKHEFADERRDVVLDRRLGERRQSLRPPPIERRHIDRRHRDVTRELQSSGWALVIFACCRPSRARPCSAPRLSSATMATWT